MNNIPLLQISDEMIDELDNRIASDALHQKKECELEEALSTLDETIMFKIDSAASALKVTERDIAYKKGFHDGMRHILTALQGGGH